MTPVLPHALTLPQDAKVLSALGDEVTVLLSGEQTETGSVWNGTELSPF